MYYCSVEPQWRHGARSIGTIEVDERLGESNAVDLGEIPREEEWCRNKKRSVIRVMYRAAKVSSFEIMT